MITVITHHKPRESISVKRCVQSVSDALQEGDCHYFLELDGSEYYNFANERFSAMKYGDYVCFVDDDDHIPSNVLSIARDCILKNPNYGIYYTRECKVIGNDIIPCKAGDKYENLIISPTSIHHLCIFNTKYITNDCLDVALKAQCGIEWAMKAYLGLTHGAMHIPIDGYYYCLHKDQLSHKMTKNFFDNHNFFKGAFAGWQKHYGQIPLYTLPEY